MVVVYGISTCDTVRKARKWLSARGIEHRFHDFRKDGLTDVQVRAWADELGWETLLNRRGTTWRRLPEETRASITDAPAAIALMSTEPTLVRRPVLDTGSTRHVGFSEAEYQELFA